VSLAPTTPSEHALTGLRWATCFVVVLALHVGGGAKLLEHADPVDSPPGTDSIELDLALGDLQPQIEAVPYTPAQPIEREVQRQEEPEKQDAEVVLPKELEEPTPKVDPTAAQEEQEAKAPAKVLPEIVRKWQLTVSTRLNQFKRYPAQARHRRHEGLVVVAFRLDTEGHLVNSRIVKSSGSPVLDEETLQLLARAQPFPVPPLGAGSNDLFMQVPINYAIR
jgi:periplasmic protein TonB